MSREQVRSDVVRYWWSKAEESLTSAQREFEAEAFAFAMNRLYYSAFYAVSAALLDKQISFTKHSGVRAAFHREFVKKGILDSNWGKFYDQLFEDRQEGDYVALTEFESEYVHSQLVRCRDFLYHLHPHIITLQQK